MRNRIIVLAHHHSLASSTVTTIVEQLKTHFEKFIIVGEIQETKNKCFELEPFVFSRINVPELHPPENYEPEPHKYFDKPKRNFKKR